MDARSEREGANSRLLIAAISALVLLGAVPTAFATLIDRIAAEVNGEIILYSEVRERVFLMKGANSSSVATGDDMEKEALESLIDQKLIIQFGKEKGIKISDRDVDAAIETTKRRMNLNKETFKRALENDGLTLERYRETLRDQILAGKVMSFEVRSQVKLLEEDIEEYYEEHLEDFTTEAKIKVRHILLMHTSQLGVEKDAEEVKAEISRIRGEIVGGLTFEDAAKKYSEGPSGASGGDLGEITKGMMLPEFEEVAFEIEPGEISEPVRTGYGYHLIKVDSKSGGKPLPFEEVRKGVENKIFQKIIAETRKDWLKRLKKTTFIDIKRTRR